MDSLIQFGGEVKSLGGGKVGGYLVYFSSADDPDTTPNRDFYTRDTDFGLDHNTKSVVLYDHTLDPTIKGKRLGRGEMKMDDVGVWIEAQLEIKDDYDRAIYALAQKGKLGWSSGTATHLVERQATKSSSGQMSNHVTCWPLGLDASLTPTPAEPRATAMALKSYAADHVSLKSLLAELSAEEDFAPEPVPVDVVGALKSLPFTDYLAAMGAIAEEFSRRVSWVHEERQVKQGRVISAGNAQMITDACDGMQGHLDRLRGLVNPSTNQKEDAQEDGLDQSGQKPDEALISAPVAQQALQAYFRHSVGATGRNFALIAQNEGGTINF